MPVVNAAANYTRVTAGQTATQIAGGGSIIVHGIVITATADALVTVLTGNGVTTIVLLRAQINTSFELRTTWLAASGLAITTDANVTCTVFHSNASA